MEEENRPLMLALSQEEADMLTSALARYADNFRPGSDTEIKAYELQDRVYRL